MRNILSRTLLSAFVCIVTVAGATAAEIHEAAQRGDLDRIRGLLGNDPALANAKDPQGRTPLHYACERGDKPIVDLLLTRGAELNAKDGRGDTALLLAAQAGKSKIARTLITKGASVDVANLAKWTPLHWAASGGQVETAKMLIKKGGKVDAKAWNQETPLYFAARNGHKRMVAYLIEAGADVQAKTAQGDTPLVPAAAFGHEEVLSLLIDKGGDPSAKDAQGSSLLHIAAANDQKDVVESLISRKMALDEGNNDGRTPLHLAAMKGHEEVSRLLIDKGAAVDPKDNKGKSPLYYAVKYGHGKEAKLLQAKGARAEGIKESGGAGAYLRKPLKEGEAYVWYLGHCGYAVKTRSRLLIFDYWRREKPPAEPALANGWIDPQEIRDLDVWVFVTHSHVDHYDPIILEWEKTVPNIHFVFGWQAGRNQKHHYLVGPRAELKEEGIEISTINSHHDDVPEVAYLVRTDGLVLLHGGDYAGDCRADYPYLAANAPGVDLAFLGALMESNILTPIETLKPKVVFPMHYGGQEAQYKPFAEQIEAKYKGVGVRCPENRGDRFFFRRPKSE